MDPKAQTNNQQPTSNNQFADFVKKLKDSGKTDAEIRTLLLGIAKLSSVELYAAIMTVLTEEDMQAVEAIADDAEAKKKMEELFAMRTGMTPAELARKTQEAFTRGYLAGGEEEKGQKGAG